MKKYISFLLSAIMIFTSFVGINVQAKDKIFIDPADEGYFNNLNNLGVFSLYNDEEFFDGTKEVTRAEAAVAIAGLLNMGQGTSSSIGDNFVDVIPTEPASGAIALMHGIGAMSGFGDNLFRPYESIETTHFVKALMVALGYNWKAEISGGYPNGYINAAASAGVLDNVNLEANQVLTRSVLLKLLNNSVFVPIYDITSVSNGQTNLEYNKDVNILTKYHHIYKDAAIVNSNSITSLNEGFIPEEGKVLIGDRTLYLGDDKSIWSHLGENITYYYKQENSGSKAYLVYFNQDDNTIVNLTDEDILSVASGVVTYSAGSDAKEKRINYSSSTLVIYNGVRGGVVLHDKLTNFSGEVSFINNNGDSSVDVIIINDYVYDEVYSLDYQREKIYFKNESIDLSEFESYSILNTQGKTLSFSEIVVGDIYAISKSADGKLIHLLNLTSQVSGKVAEKGTDICVIDGTSYKLSAQLCAEILPSLKIGDSYTFYLNSANKVVYIKEGIVQNLSLGYLVDCETEANAFDSKLHFKILSGAGTVEYYQAAEKVKVNGETLKYDEVLARLTQLKNNLNLVSDGRVSQVVRFSTNSEGLLTTIHTALLEDNDYLQLKYNSEGANVFLRDHGYGVGAFDYKHLIGNKTTFFQVPKENQSSMSDDYYITFRYQDKMEDGHSYTVETYTISDEIYPAAAVYYPTEATASGIDPYANLFLVDEVSQSTNSLGDPVTKFTGYVNGVPATYESLDILDVSDVSKGDVLVFNLTALNGVRDYIKVYDVSENKIDENYYNEDITVQKSVSMFSVYKAKGDYMEATNKGFSNMDTALDNMYGLNMSRVDKIAVYDSKTDTITLDGKSSIVDYIHAGNDCTKILIRYQHAYMMNVIIYK